MRANEIQRIAVSTGLRCESNIGLPSHIFVHTEKMKQELMKEFGTSEANGSQSFRSESTTLFQTRSLVR